MKQNLKFTLVLFTCLSNVLINNAQVPSWQWANNSSGLGQDRAYCAKVDNIGNIYVAGQFSDSSITFGATTLLNRGHEDIFIVKYDPSGNVLWAIAEGDTGIDVAYGVTCDSSGNVYITGNFQSAQMTIGNTTLTNAGLNDIFIAKYDENGAAIWAQSNGGNGIDFGNSIKSDNNGYIYLTGNFASPSITFGTTTLTAFGTSKSFTVKYDEDGNVIWANGSDYTSYDQGKCIAVDGNGNVFSAGLYYDFSVIIGSDTLSNQGNNDIYLAKYDQSGTFLWATSAGGFNTDEVNGVVADDAGNVYITGNFFSPFISFGSTTINNAGYPGWDIFIAKYTSAGNLVWVRSATSNIFEDASTGIALDAFGNVVISGWYQDSLTLGATTLHSAGGYDLFVAGFDTSGNALWAKSAGGADNDFAMTLAVSPGAVYTAGFYDSPSCDFGGFSISDANSGFDMFVAKLNNIISSIPESEIESDLLLFPNPSNNYIKVSTSFPGKMSVKLFSQIGQCVYESNLSAGESIDVSDLAKGIYICEFKQGDYLLKRKVAVY